MPFHSLAHRLLRLRRTESSPAEPPALPSRPDPLRALTSRERRLVCLAISLRGAGVGELLELLADGRGSELCRAATELAGLERGERRAVVARELAREIPTGRDAQRLAAGLEPAPAWFRAHACSELPSELRESLLADPAVRRAWSQLASHHPAVTRWARRRLAVMQRGTLFRGGTPAVPARNTQRMRPCRPA